MKTAPASDLRERWVSHNRVFVYQGNPRHRWNCRRADFFLTPDTDVRVRTRSTL